MGLLSFRKKKKDAGAHVEPEFKPRHDDAPVRSRTKERKNSSSEPVDPVLPEKKRARRRLLGAVALVVAVVIGLPMVLDSEPKPLADDIAIKIPSKDKSGGAADTPVAGASSASTAASIAATLDPKEDIVSPPAPSASTSKATTAATATAATAAVATAALAAKAAPAAPAATAAPAPAAPAPQEAKPPEPKPAAAAPSKPAPAAPQNTATEARKPEVKKPEPKKPEPKKPEVKKVEKVEPKKPEPKKPEPKPAPAKPVVEAKPEPKGEPVTLQIAALASTDKVNEVLAKLRSAGIASYSQKINTDAGERTRIRVTVANKAEAEKMKAKLAAIGLGGAAVVPSH